MKKNIITVVSLLVVFLFSAGNSEAFNFPGRSFSLWGSGPELIAPANGMLVIPVEDINDGKAHHYRVKADDGTLVTFFILKSREGVIRAAIDACDVCYRAGKGYVQDGDHMVCINCGQRFASEKINVVKGGCNPAPLERRVETNTLIISMSDINQNSWYCKFRKS